MSIIKVKRILDNFNDKFNMKLCIGSELEFYFENFSDKKYREFMNMISNTLPNHLITKERGERQYEIIIPKTFDILFHIKNITIAKNIISTIAQECEMVANFMAKPYENEPGNALHINISAFINGRNIFTKHNNQDSDYILYAIGGLCHNMKKDLKVFLPSKESYKRIIPKNNAPTTVSWGGNNRTVAIRIPTTESDNYRIEHRVSGSDADPEQVILKIIKAIFQGIEQKITPPKKIYGDASDQQYQLPLLLE